MHACAMLDLMQSKRVIDVQNIFSVTRMESKSIAPIMQTAAHYELYLNCQSRLLSNVKQGSNANECKANSFTCRFVQTPTYIKLTYTSEQNTF